jgi:flagellar basal-body rod protein FlgG
VDRSIFVALSGAVTQEKRLDVLSENLANINTPGFKKRQLLFEAVVAETGVPRYFSSSREVVTNMSQGFMKRSGRDLDMAIQGQGFFEIDTPDGIRYTRNGTFTVDKGGSLVTSEGYGVLGASGVMKLRGSTVLVSSDGTISDKDGTLGKLNIISFENPSMLVREGNYYSVPGSWVAEAPLDGLTEVVQGHLEMSNVNAVRAMTTMIDCMRSYESQSKMIQAIDDITRKAIEEVGKG